MSFNTMKRTAGSSSRELWTTSEPEDPQLQEEVILPELRKPGPRSWKVKVKRAREEKEFADVEDLLVSGSEDEEDEAKEDKNQAKDGQSDADSRESTDQDVDKATVSEGVSVDSVDDDANSEPDSDIDSVDGDYLDTNLLGSSNLIELTSKGNEDNAFLNMSEKKEGQDSQVTSNDAETDGQHNPDDVVLEADSKPADGELESDSARKADSCNMNSETDRPNAAAEPPDPPLEDENNATCDGDSRTILEMTDNVAAVAAASQTRDDHKISDEQTNQESTGTEQKVSPASDEKANDDKNVIDQDVMDVSSDVKEDISDTAKDDKIKVEEDAKVVGGVEEDDKQLKVSQLSEDKPSIGDHQKEKAEGKGVNSSGTTNLSTSGDSCISSRVEANAEKKTTSTEIKRGGGGVECPVCGQILPQSRLDSHKSLPHFLECPVDGCGRRFILQKTLDRHQRQVHPTENATKPSPANTTNSSRTKPNAELTTSASTPSSKSNENLQNSLEVASEENTKEISPRTALKDLSEHLSLFLKESTAAKDMNHSTSDSFNEVEETESPSKKEADKDADAMPGPAAHDVVMDDGIDHSVDPEKGPFICKFCKEEFKTWSILTRHFITPHLFKCSFCTLTFNRQTTLEDHVNTLHDLTSSVDSMVCNLCGETFKRAATMARHVQLPHPFECDKCGRSFPAALLLKKHWPVCPNKHLVVPDQPEPDAGESGKAARGGRKRSSPTKDVARSGGKRRAKQSRSESPLDSDSDDNSSSEEDMEQSSDRDDEGSPPPTPLSRGKRKSTPTSASRGSKVRRKIATPAIYSSSSASETDAEETIDHSSMKKTPVGKRQVITSDVDSDNSDAEDDNDEVDKSSTRLPDDAGQVGDTAGSVRACRLCDDTFATAQGLRLHSRREHKFACANCDKKFIAKTKLSAHVRSDHGKGAKRRINVEASSESEEEAGASKDTSQNRDESSPTVDPAIELDCPLCDFSVRSLDADQRASVITKHRAKVHCHDCSLCNTKCVSATILLAHQLRRHPDLTSEATVACDQCEKEFGADGVDGGHVGDLDEYIVHAELPHLHQCEPCGLAYTTVIELDGHLKTDHLSDDCQKCEMCGVMLVSSAQAAKHLKLSHHHDCSECELHFATNQRMEHHMYIDHGTDLTHRDPNKSLSCDTCGAKFGGSLSAASAELDKYLSHLETEHRNTCHSCSLTFVFLLEAERHAESAHQAPKAACQHCAAEMTAGEELARHAALKHAHGCGLCTLAFVNGSDLTKHTEISHMGMPLICRLCGQEFGEGLCVELSDHISNQSHHIKCDRCHMVFVTKEDKDRHSLDIHGIIKGLDLKCGQCLAEFSDTALFRQHFRVPHRLQCKHCELRFPEPEDLLRHVGAVHKKKAKPPNAKSILSGPNDRKHGSPIQNKSQSPPARKDKLECEKCDKTFNLHEKRQFQEHIGLTHKYKCDSCDLVFVKSSRLRDHVGSKHEGGLAKLRAFDDKYTCRMCGHVCSKGNNVTESQEALAYHRSLPHKLPCKKCSLRFTNKSRLEEHLKNSHSGAATPQRNKGSRKDAPADRMAAKRGHSSGSPAAVASNECPICGTHFTELSALREHKRKPHTVSCEDNTCSKRFVNVNALERHLKRKHTQFSSVHVEGGKLVYDCRLCGQGFLQHHQLRSHQALDHSQNCHVCSHQFVLKEELSQHLSHQHKINRIPTNGFSCSLCMSHFSQMLDMRKHFIQPHRYRCNQCPLSFTSGGEYLAHKDHEHGVVETSPPAASGPDLDAMAEETPLKAHIKMLANSRSLKDHLLKIIVGKVDSRRHSMFHDPVERHLCNSSEDSVLFSESYPRYMNLTPDMDHDLVNALQEVYRSSQVHPCPLPGWEYVSCVLVPEFWLYYLTHIRKLRKVKAEQKLASEIVAGQIKTEWKEFVRDVKLWKHPPVFKNNHHSDNDDCIQIISPTEANEPVKPKPKTETPVAAKPKETQAAVNHQMASPDMEERDPRKRRLALSGARASAAPADVNSYSSGSGQNNRPRHLYSPGKPSENFPQRPSDSGHHGRHDEPVHHGGKDDSSHHPRRRGEHGERGRHSDGPHHGHMVSGAGPGKDQFWDQRNHGGYSSAEVDPHDTYDNESHSYRSPSFSNDQWYDHNNRQEAEHGEGRNRGRPPHVQGDSQWDSNPNQRGYGHSRGSRGGRGWSRGYHGGGNRHPHHDRYN